MKGCIDGGTRKKENIKRTVKLHIFPHYRPLGLIFFIRRDNHHPSFPAPIQRPPTYLTYKPLEFGPLQRQPTLQHLPLDFAATLSHARGDPHPHQLLKATDIGDQIRVQVVTVEGGPESLVVGLRQQRVERGELLDGFGKRRVAGRGKRCVGWEWGENVRGKQVEAEAEVGGREHGEGFDEDICGGFVASEMWVELVAVGIHEHELGVSRGGSWDREKGNGEERKEVR